MRFAYAVGLLSAQAARLNIHNAEELENEMFMWTEAATLTNETESNKICDTLWPKELDSQFKNARYVGSGATACVYLAKDKRGSTVAVKVGKHASAAKKAAQLKEWTDECQDMKDLRVKACEGGSEILALHEHYMPSCFMVGSYAKGAYYAMHAAGPTPIRDVPDIGFTVKQAQSVFAQFVESVYALHSIEMSHNDLHGQNIVLDGDSLQLIDLGSLKTCTQTGGRCWRKGYKRDSNAIWRWGAKLADCDESAQWPQMKPAKPAMQKAADAFHSCVKAKWNPDPEFMGALKDLLNGDVNEDKDHHIVELYKTKWIQALKPKHEQKFVSDETEKSGCKAWTKDQWATHWFKQKYPNHVKCETIPSYKWVTTKTKRGKTRTIDHFQCAIPGRTFDSACYRMGLKGSEIWGCGGCGNAGEMNPRACFFKTHEHYDKVPDYSA